MGEVTLQEHHDKVMDKLCDIDEHMEGNTMTEGFDSGMLAGLLSNKGIDPAALVAMLDNKRDGWGSDGAIWIVLLFLFMLGMGGNGVFGRNGVGGTAEGLGVAGVDRTIVNQSNYEQLLNAIGTQGTRQEMAVQNLANALNCDVNSIKTALCTIDKDLALTGGDIKSAIQNCCCNISNLVSSTSCATQRAIENQGCQTREAISGLGFQMQTIDAATRQFIQQSFCDQNAYLADQFCQIKQREDAREIQALRDKVQEQRENANTQAILTAIANKDVVSGTYNSTAATFTGNIS